MRLGVIADDFTGATDIASFLAQNGMPTVQINGVPAEDMDLDEEAIVISLKSRSCPSQQAIDMSLEALQWLQKKGCNRFYFKYCSTFDSTETGNIGPVTDALMHALGQTQTILSPSLPVNGRTVYQGYLFVGDQLLSESGMRNHPLTPMTDSNIMRLMMRQSLGKSAVITASVIDKGADAVRHRLEELKNEGISYVVLDALNEGHLVTQGKALNEMVLLTGGSGLAIGVARAWPVKQHHTGAEQAGFPQGNLAIILSGSCSQMTNKQVEFYQQLAPSCELSIERCIADVEGYAQELCDWVASNSQSELAPMIYATADATKLKVIQQHFGATRSSEAVEQLFSAVVRVLKHRGWQRFIVAGGETSGVVAQSLGVTAFHIGPTISPGVPWVRDIHQPLSLALKSGNFGDEFFFIRAQEEFAV